MLNSDMCLIKDITFVDDRGDGEPACTYDTCGDSATRGTVEEFANDNDLFVTEYASCCFTYHPLRFLSSSLVCADRWFAPNILSSGSFPMAAVQCSTTPAGFFYLKY